MSPEQWAEKDNASFRAACERANNPWRMKIPPVMPAPALEGQSLTWGKNICGLWSYRRYLAINGKWVDMVPTDKDYHPFNCKLE